MIEAMSGSSSQDDNMVTNLLIQWTVFALFRVFEFFLGFIISYMPFYFELKLAFILWMQFADGANFLYNNYIVHIMTKLEPDIDESVKKLAGATSADF